MPLDAETRKHTVVQQVVLSTYDTLKRRVQEFVNAVRVGSQASRGDVAAVSEEHPSSEVDPA